MIALQSANVNEIFTAIFFIVWPVMPVIGAFISLFNLREAIIDWNYAVDNKFNVRRKIVIQGTLIQEAIVLFMQFAFAVFNIYVTANRTVISFNVLQWFYAVALFIVSFGLTLITLNSWYVRKNIFHGDDK